MSGSDLIGTKPDLKVVHGRRGRGIRVFVLMALVVSFGLAACDDENDPPSNEDQGVAGDLGAEVDAGADAATPCVTHLDCDDGVYCNGPERCDAFDPRADSAGCAPALAAAVPCDPGEQCDESDRTCVVCDGDRDGSPGAQCGGTDCDDADGRRSPGSTEVCDGFDNDCDEKTDEHVSATYWVDTDSDGFGSDAVDAETMQACSRPVGFADNASDCDDAAPSVNPGNPEICDTESVDEDCDGTSNPPSLCN